MKKTKDAGRKPNVKKQAEADKATVSASDCFVDPRKHYGRRMHVDPDLIPKTGCRRRVDRRKREYLKDDDWWIRRNYNNSDEC